MDALHPLDAYGSAVDSDDRGRSPVLEAIGAGPRPLSPPEPAIDPYRLGQPGCARRSGVGSGPTAGGRAVKGRLQAERGHGAKRTARHLARVHEISAAVEDADLDDLVPVLGFRPDSWAEGDALLERYVLADASTGEHDEQLVQLFHRRNLRTHTLLGPPGSKMVAHHPTQRFDAQPVTPGR
jgi:hypothetical protein